MEKAGPSSLGVQRLENLEENDHTMCGLAQHYDKLEDNGHMRGGFLEDQRGSYSVEDWVMYRKIWTKVLVVRFCCSQNIGWEVLFFSKERLY